MSLSLDTNHYLYTSVDRGPQSIITGFQLYDASGHLLEDIQNYHAYTGSVVDRRNTFLSAVNGFHLVLTLNMAFAAI